jgi:hypothetical protein
VRARARRWLWQAGSWLAFRRLRPRPQDYARHDLNSQTRGRRHFSEFVRDRLRPRWLRIRREDS